jgi:hypothetical protein
MGGLGFTLHKYRGHMVRLQYKSQVPGLCVLFQAQAGTGVEPPTHQVNHTHSTVKKYPMIQTPITLVKDHSRI